MCDVIVKSQDENERKTNEMAQRPGAADGAACEELELCSTGVAVMVVLTRARFLGGGWAAEESSSSPEHIHTRTHKLHQARECPT